MTEPEGEGRVQHMSKGQDDGTGARCTDGCQLMKIVRRGATGGQTVAG
jgi:hypothetical protein